MKNLLLVLILVIISNPLLAKKGSTPKSFSCTQEISIDISKQFDSSWESWLYAPFTSVAIHLLGSINNNITLRAILRDSKFVNVRTHLNGTTKKSILGFSVEMSIANCNLDKSETIINETGSSTLKNTYSVFSILKIATPSHSSSRELEKITLILEAKL